MKELKAAFYHGVTAGAEISGIVLFVVAMLGSLSNFTYALVGMALAALISFPVHYLMAFFMPKDSDRKIGDFALGLLAGLIVFDLLYVGVLLVMKMRVFDIFTPQIIIALLLLAVVWMVNLLISSRKIEPSISD